LPQIVCRSERIKLFGVGNFDFGTFGFGVMVTLKKQVPTFISQDHKGNKKPFVRTQFIVIETQFSGSYFLLLSNSEPLVNAEKKIDENFPISEFEKIKSQGNKKKTKKKIYNETYSVTLPLVNKKLYKIVKS
jgi:hypothetical protein